jgi:DNA-binding NarL/FixJ family response regulator
MSEYQRKKVMIVDDEERFLDLVQDSLTTYPNIKPILHRSFTGYDVIETVNAVDPDILFLDVKLPDVSGARLSVLLKEKDIKYPIYLISSWKEDELKDLLKDNQAEGFIHKSNFTESILNILEKHFGSEIRQK